MGSLTTTTMFQLLLIVACNAGYQGAHYASPKVLANAPAVYADHGHVSPKVPEVVLGAPAVYADHGHASPVVYADHAGHGKVVYGDAKAAYGYGAPGYGSDYRFSGLHSPVTAGHYIGFGNKYGFRAGYPYGNGEMLNYTPAKGYSLESGWEKLMTRQPAKYSYNHGYVPLTPVHYKKGINTLKH